MEKLCKRCNKLKPVEEFYKNSNNTKTDSYCKICCCEQVLERQRKLKRMCVEYKGGKCENCGYDKCMAALEFHHIDPAEKDFQISKINRFSIIQLNPEIKQELNKCKILCSNCHKEEHFRLNEEKYVGIRENPTFWEKKKSKYCLDCGHNIHQSKLDLCFKCYKKKNPNLARGKKTKIIWPSNEELKQRLLTTSFVKLGQELGVTDNAIRKHLKYKKMGPP